MFREKKKKMDNLNIFFTSDDSSSSNLNNNTNNNQYNFNVGKGLLSNTQKTNYNYNYNFKQINFINNANQTANSPLTTNATSHSISLSNPKLSKSKTLTLERYKSHCHTKTPVTIQSKSNITEIEFKYESMLKEKDNLISDLQKEIAYLKKELQKKNNSNPNANSCSSCSSNLKASSQINKKTSAMKSSFDFNTSYIKTHERLLSERITKFYTPKANELIRNFNIEKNQFISTTRGNNGKTFSTSKNKKKVSMTTKKSVKTVKTSIPSMTNIANEVKEVKVRVSNLIERLFSAIESNKNRK